MAHAGKLQIPHVERDGDVILTATTEELQQFVSRHAGDDEAFPPNPGFARMK